jgi:hypothetical protein
MKLVVPRLKLRGALTLVGAASVWLWLQGISLAVLLIGTFVIALTLVSIHNRGRVAVEIKAEGDRPRSLTRAGIIGYSIAITLAFAWLASVWFWQVFDHEAFKSRLPITPTVRAKPAPILEAGHNIDIPGL